MCLLPLDHRLEHLFDRLFVADKVVVNEKGVLDTVPQQGIELGDHLPLCLEARTPTKNDNDVTELASKRTTPRKLHGAERVAAHLEKVAARHRDRGHVGLGALFVARLVTAFLPFGEKPRPGPLGLADEEDISPSGEEFLACGCERSADDDQEAEPVQLVDIANIRVRCTIIPVTPTMSARAQRAKSIGSTFSSIKVTLCSAGVSAASRGSEAIGEAALARRKGIAYSRPYMEASKRGLIRTISATAWPPSTRRRRAPRGLSPQKRTKSIRP